MAAPPHYDLGRSADGEFQAVRTSLILGEPAGGDPSGHVAARNRDTNGFLSSFGFTTLEAAELFIRLQQV